MSLQEKRYAIRHLLDARHPADALADYFAFHHGRTQLTTYPYEVDQAVGYVALSRTGIDLFRPFMTVRLPITDMATSATLVYDLLRPGTAVIANVPTSHFPLMQAFFDIQTEETLQLFVLDRGRFEPIVNVLVTQDKMPNGEPRFVIRSTEGHEIIASAGLNWQTSYYAEIVVNTRVRHRRRGWGQSVVAAAVQSILENGRTPLYAVATHNQASINLAQSIGFVDTGFRQVIFEGTLKPTPG